MTTGRGALQTIYFPKNNRVWRTMWLNTKILLRFTICTNIAKSTRNSSLAALRIYGSLIKAFAFAMAFVVPPQVAEADSRLIMVTSDHCPYCQAWELNVGTVYEKSPYAPTLPLTRVEIGNEIPGSVTLKKPVFGTPTFLIIHNGQEIDRQSGYIDAEMFWWWLSEYAVE